MACRSGNQQIAGYLYVGLPSSPMPLFLLRRAICHVLSLCLSNAISMCVKGRRSLADGSARAQGAAMAILLDNPPVYVHRIMNTAILGTLANLFIILHSRFGCRTLT